MASRHSSILGLVLATVAVASPVGAQTIEPFAGTGVQGSLDGPRLSARIGFVEDIAIAPNGTIYFVDDRRLRTIDSNGAVATVLGTGAASGPGGGSGNIGITDVAIDLSGNVYVVDFPGRRILRFTAPATFTPFAGTGVSGFSGDGEPAISAQFSSIYGIDFDAAGSLYVADGNRIRRITADGVVATIATAPFSFGPSTFGALTSANLAVSADGTAYVNRGGNNGFGLWRSTPGGAFELVSSSAPPSFPFKLCVTSPVSEQVVAGPARRGPDGLIYIANGSCLSRLTPTGRMELLGGSAMAGPDAAAGQLGPLSAARFSGMNALAFDASGRLYLADARNYRIRRVTGLPVFVNATPVANAGPDAAAVEGDTFQFDARGSTDPDGDTLRFAWTVLSRPPGSVTALLNETLATPQLRVDVPGTYTLRVQVSDGADSATDDVSLVVRSVAAYATELLGNVSSSIDAMPDSALQSPGLRWRLTRFLADSVSAAQAGNWARALSSIEAALERTDGCPIRGSYDSNGPERDWIQDCAFQYDTYNTLSLVRAKYLEKLP